MAKRPWLIQGKAHVALTLIAGVASAAVWTLISGPAVGPEPFDVGQQVDIVGVRPLPTPGTRPTPRPAAPSATPSAAVPSASLPGRLGGSAAGHAPTDRRPSPGPSAAPSPEALVTAAPGAGTPAVAPPTPAAGTVRGDAFPGGEQPGVDGGAGKNPTPKPAPRLTAGPSASSAGSGTPPEPTGEAVTLAGGLDGLYPGAVMALRLTVTNDHPFAIDVLDIQTAIGGSSREGCAATDIAVDPWGGRVTIPARATGTIDAVITMSQDAPDVCQGASWPLVFRSSAVRSEP